VHLQIIMLYPVGYRRGANLLAVPLIQQQANSMYMLRRSWAIRHATSFSAATSSTSCGLSQNSGAPSSASATLVTVRAVTGRPGLNSTTASTRSPESSRNALSKRLSMCGTTSVRRTRPHARRTSTRPSARTLSTKGALPMQ
jgi:hypothetical protein